MKNLTYVLLIMFVSLIGNTAILTVNNNNPSPGQYSDLQVAVDAASAGDTLLIHRSSTSYGNVTITKKLVLIGEGALPNKIPLTQRVQLGDLTLTYDNVNLTNASKTKLYGLLISRLFIYEKDNSLAYSVDSVEVRLCSVNTMTLKGNVVGLICEYSFFNVISSGFLFNSSFKYNFIYNAGFGNAQGENNIFTNNIITYRLLFKGGIFANNIFYDDITTPIAIGCQNVIFSNNLFYGVSTVFNPTLLEANGCISVNNIVNIDPMFNKPDRISIVMGYTHTSPASGPFADFHLQTGSPAIGAGTDGTDLGIYGGSTPWRDGDTTDSRYRYFPFPDAVPVITNLTIQNPVVNEGGNLQIQLNATTDP